MRQRFLRITICLYISLVCISVRADNLTDGMQLKIEASATVGSGDYAPMWLTSNRNGIVSPFTNSSYERVALSRNSDNDSCRLWKIGYGIDLMLNQHGLSPFMIHQAFGEVSYKLGTLTVGQKESTLEFKNDELSSGAQALGINAVPIPQVRLELNDFWIIPLGGRWVGFKGHIAYGRYTDDNWQKDFTEKKSRYVENQLYHSKAGFLRIHKPSSPLTITLGIEMAAQFGGTSYRFFKDGKLIGDKNGSGIKSYFNALLPGFGSDNGEGLYGNCEGNTLGSWIARIDYDTKGSTFSLYADKFFEDHSAMFQIDYDGYGSGDDWNKKVGRKFIMYDFSDIMLGAEWKKHTPWYVDNVVVEYLHTKYQSGPINHDRTPQMSDHTAGLDSYYQHHIFTGWQHWGMVCGNPLYLSSYYNGKGEYMSHCTRFIAFHTGIGGTLSPRLTYRVLASWQRGWGTYDYIFPDPKENISAMCEVRYSNFKMFGIGNWGAKAAIGIDNGALRGNNFGVQATISKTFNY